MTLKKKTACDKFFLSCEVDIMHVCSVLKYFSEKLHSIVFGSSVLSSPINISPILYSLCAAKTHGILIDV